MPTIELAANLSVTGGASASKLYYLGPLPMAGFNALSVQGVAIGSITNTVKLFIEVSIDSQNWVDGNSTSTVSLNLSSSAPSGIVSDMIEPARKGAAFARLRVEATAGSSATIAVTVNTFNS